MDYTQALLFAVVTTLTLLLLIVGVQVFLILRKTQRTLDEINKILKDANLLTTSISRPITGMINFVEGLKNIKHLVDFVSEKTGIRSFEEIVESDPDKPREKGSHIHPHIHALQERGRRFFHKGGKPLSS
ncbi:MAG: hypothetical protein Q7R44_00010 [bacterium]|nr:hypothetical protein [bacterium]